jgi:uncharacterized protein (DUF3820 family)
MELVCNACGSIDDYHTTEKHYKIKTGETRTHYQAICNGCGGYIKNLPQLHKPQTFIPFGKYKGQHTYQINDEPYLKWLHGVTDAPRLKIGIEIRLKELNGGCGNG